MIVQKCSTGHLKHVVTVLGGEVGGEQGRRPGAADILRGSIPC